MIETEVGVCFEDGGRNRKPRKGEFLYLRKDMETDFQPGDSRGNIALPIPLSP